MHRTVTATIPNVQPREIVATALLEAPDVNGQPGAWTALEAVPHPADTVMTAHADHDPGWYRLQWYDDGRVSSFSEPVRLSGEHASNTGRSRR